MAALFCMKKLYLLNTVHTAHYLKTVPAVLALLDILALDILGLDILGLDILGLDILGMTRSVAESSLVGVVVRGIIWAWCAIECSRRVAIGVTPFER